MQENDRMPDEMWISAVASLTSHLVNEVESGIIQSEEGQFVFDVVQISLGTGAHPLDIMETFTRLDDNSMVDHAMVDAATIMVDYYNDMRQYYEE